MKSEKAVIKGDSKVKILSQEREISESIINQSRSMISVINRNYVYEKVNLAFCNAHNINFDQIIGKSLSDIWGSQIFFNFIKNNIDLCFAGKTVNYEASFETPGFGTRYFEVTFRPLAVEGNEITHLIAETFDINESKRRELEIKEKEEALRKFETNLPIGIVRCSADGNIIHANKAFLSIMDCLDENSIKNANFKSFYPQEFLFDVQCEQLLEKHIMNFGRVSLHDCRGTEISCRISGFLVFDSSGNQPFMDFVVEDATRELMLENRLIQAQKLETIGALAGGIAHDFNNILTTISGYSELLMEDLPSNSDLSEKVGKIQGAVLRAKSITNQILTFSRQVEQEKIAISVSEVLKETLEFIKSSIPGNIELQSNIPNIEVKVLADPTQLFRIFINLMTNAIQAMEDSGGVLSVEMDVIEGKHLQHQLNKNIVADEYVLLTFKDTGKGMEQSVLGRIFEPFYTTRDIGKGTGLGLSVTYGIISEIDGEILVASKRDEGSEFFVYLPVTRQDQSEESFSGQKKRILFIAGNKHESRMLTMALENTGFDLMYISDRQGLVKSLSKDGDQTDLIVYMTDSGQVLPEDFLNIFRQMKIDTPCIIITNQNCSIFEEKLLNSGIVKQHLIKPVSLKEIKSAIQLSI
jgi:PAS domain S-box-containing protein